MYELETEHEVFLGDSAFFTLEEAKEYAMQSVLQGQDPNLVMINNLDDSEVHTLKVTYKWVKD